MKIKKSLHFSSRLLDAQDAKSTLKHLNTKKCLDCKKEFEVKPFAKYERKYCLNCSKKRKKMWENQWQVKFEDISDEE